MAFLASWVIWEESLSIILKFLIEGKGWWKSVQCLSMADVLNLEFSLTLSPRDLEVSPMSAKQTAIAPHTLEKLPGKFFGWIFSHYLAAEFSGKNSEWKKSLNSEIFLKLKCIFWLNYLWIRLLVSCKLTVSCSIFLYFSFQLCLFE